MGRAVYVGSSLLNATRVKEIQNRFREAGIAITYDWSVHGKISDDRQLAEVGELEEQGVRDCDLFFMIHPARNGTHVELGMARVLDKHIVILEETPAPEKKTFYYRPEGHKYPIHRFTDPDQAVNFAIELLQEKR